MGSDKHYNVLFLCTGNSARSIFAEAILNRLGRGTFRAFSAGSRPKGEVHPLALDLLRRLNFSTEGVRSKGWEEFSGPSASSMDFVSTVCDRRRIYRRLPSDVNGRCWALVCGADTKKPAGTLAYGL